MGDPACVISVVRDVTAAKRAEEDAKQARLAAEASASRLASVLESTTDSVVMLDLEWQVTYANQRALSVLEARGLRLGESLWKAFPEEENGVFAQHYRRALQEQTPVSFEAYLTSHGIWLEVHAYPAPDGLSIFFRDMTEQRAVERERVAAQQQIAHLARHDGLTGLPNRLFFRERLQRSLTEHPQDGRCAVLSLDLDGFTASNDALGHASADKLLRQFAERLQSKLRSTDILAHFGGDEFAILQGPIRQAQHATRLARRIVEALAQPFDVDGHQVSIAASIGIAVDSGEGTTTDELIRGAAVALYTAKTDRRGSYVVFEPGMQKVLRARQAIKAALQQALPRGELELHYQPLVRLSSGEVSCFEALLRWQHPQRGSISPAEFIPVAEESGLILSIGKWALEEACRTAASWPGHISVAVNLSPAQFKADGLVEAVKAALRASGLQPGRLQLEITESLPLEKNGRNLAILQQLRCLGVRIAMDDFGTGHSSLSYLQSFPFDKIKLDQCFVRGLPGSPEAQAIVRAVAGLGATLRMTTVAEGIETEDQLTALRAMGYDEVQGYLFCRPVPAGQIGAAISACRRQIAAAT